MLYHKFLITLVLYVSLIQLTANVTVNAAALKKGKGGGKGGKKPAQPVSKTPPSSSSSSSTSSKAAPTSKPTACSLQKRGTNQGECQMQTDAPWYLQRISQIPWTNVPQFQKDIAAQKFSFQWNSTWGKDVIIYVIDSEVNAGHKAFKKGQVEAGDQVFSLDDVESVPDPADHGTGVASCIVGQLNGVARQGIIFPIKLPAPRSTDEEPGEALTIAIRDWKVRSAKNPALRAVVNISWGMGDNPPTEAALEWAILSGMHIVHAAGNQGTNQCYNDTPMGTSYRGPKNVGQITVSGFVPVVNAKKDKTVDTYVNAFNHGSCIDVLAPGVTMMVAHGNGYKYVSGTSHAAGVTSGVVAALLSSHPGYRDLKPEEFRKQFMAEFTQTGLEGLPPGTADRMLTIEKLLKFKL